MIPQVVPRHQLLAANGIFTLTLNAAFALGFALLGPLVVNVAGPAGPDPRRRGALLHRRRSSASPSRRRRHRPETGEGAPSGRGDVAGRPHDRRPAARRHRVHPLQPRDRLVAVLPRHRRVARRRARRARAGFAETTLGLEPKDLVVVVLPARLRHRDGHPAAQQVRQVPAAAAAHRVRAGRAGRLLAVLSVAGPISRCLQRRRAATGLIDLSAATSLLAIVVAIAFLAGIAYASSRSRPRPSSRRTCRRTSAAACSAS